MPMKLHFITEDVHENNSAKELVIHEEGEDETSGKKNEKSLLIIEDDEEIRAFLKDHLCAHVQDLRSSRMEPMVSDMAQSHHPDLIISDIMMPGLDGIELCRQLKQNMRTSHIPHCLTHRENIASTSERRIETGADAYITKPFSPEILALTTHPTC